MRNKQLLEKGSKWKYLDNGSDQGTAWKEPGFEDNSWKSAPAPLRLSSSVKNVHCLAISLTVISYGPDSHKQISDIPILERNLK